MSTLSFVFKPRSAGSALVKCTAKIVRRNCCDLTPPKHAKLTSGLTALHLAGVSSKPLSTEILKALLEADADRNATKKAIPRKA